MNPAIRFVGRESERAELGGLLELARAGRGGLALVAGEAGVGKSRLVTEALRAGGQPVLVGAASEGDTSAFAPVRQVLRTHLRSGGVAGAALGPLAAHLAVLLPELGPPAVDGDRATLFEAIRQAFVAIGTAGGTAAFLDDLQWADDATLELLLALGAGLQDARILLIGAYRSDEIPRGHPLRRFRAELRRKGLLREIAVEPLSAGETRDLAAEILGAPPSAALAARLYDRSQGVPLFVEELTAAVRKAGRLRSGPDGLDVAAGGELPLPESIRDAVILRSDGLSATGRHVLEVASVLGVRFDPGLVGALTGEEQALIESVERGLLLELEPGLAAFRHALTREAIYQEIPWPRRRSIHRDVARQLEPRGAPPDVRAAHWLDAREFGPARRALIAAAEAACHVHAYRDAMRVARRALELWGEGEDETDRLALLDRLGRCAELSGDLAEAARAWSEVAEARKRAGNLYEFAELQRRLAAVYGLQGAWERALAAHREAADAFAAHGLPGEAAVERLAAAEHLDGSGSRRAALELVRIAARDAALGDRIDLRALALGLEGQLRVELGEGEAGLETIREALNLALVHALNGAAAELHYRLAWALSELSDYASARGAYEAGLEFCQAHGLADTEQQCLACYAGMLIEVGGWKRAVAICRELIDERDTNPIVAGAASVIAGVLHALQGKPRPARRLLAAAEAQTRHVQVLGLELSILWGLAAVDELEGASASAADRTRTIRERWEETDDLYYAIHPLRWAATFLAEHGLGSEVRACADALASLATRKGSPEALAALAHALGECALLDGEPEQATEHFEHALETLQRLGLRYQHACTQVRTATAMAAAGERERAVERFVDAHRLARRLGATPLAGRAAAALRELGEPLEARLGRRAARRLDNAGLTRRELQVLRLVNAGMSNRDIARELFLSPRTVEMHVGNTLLKLGCGTRTEAAHRARELGVIA